MELAGRQAMVVGLAAEGLAAAELLCRRGARVTVVAEEPERVPKERWERLNSLGVPRVPAAEAVARRDIDVVIRGGARPAEAAAVLELRRRGVPVISALELGFRASRCLHIAVAGTNGKSTTVALIRQLLEQTGRRVRTAGGGAAEVCDLAEQTPELDYVVVEVSPLDLVEVDEYRPALAVLLNLVGGVREGLPTDEARDQAVGHLFRRQEAFDWAIVQSEALARLQSAGRSIPSKVITFSANNRRADFVLDRQMVISRMADWAGPLMNLEASPFRWVHFAEDLMATLGVGRVLRISLEEMVAVLVREQPPADCCEPMGELGGVTYVNDARSRNLDTLRKALESAAGVPLTEPNVVLIAGGHDDGFEFHDLGPLLSQRVKQVWLLGDAAVRMRAAWSLFTPCTPAGSVLEAVQRSAEIAVPGDVVLFSPACSCGDVAETHQRRGELFREAVRALSVSLEVSEGKGGVARGGVTGDPASSGGAGAQSGDAPETRGSVSAKNFEIQSNRPGQML